MSNYLCKGFQTSQFFKRAKVALPGQATFTSNPPDCYKPQHMFVGAAIVVNNFPFVLIDADDYALRYMELNDQEVNKKALILKF